MYKLLKITLALIIPISITGCSINESTGKIKLVNFTKTAATNIVLGETVICSLLSAGAVADYWFFNSDITDVIPKASGFKYALKNKEITFKLNHHGTLEFRSVDSGYTDEDGNYQPTPVNLIYAFQGEEQGESMIYTPSKNKQ